jgi:hypothetical protein
LRRQLTGVSGAMTIEIAGGAHKYQLTYTLDNAAGGGVV